MARTTALRRLSRRRLLALLSRFRGSDQVILFLLAVVVGAAGGLSAIAFRLTIAFVERLAYGTEPEHLASGAALLPWWQLLLVPSLGGLVIGLFVHFLMPGRRPQAVAQVIEASVLRGGQMSLSTGLKAALVSAASIGVGASVGREGPVVHLGATLGAQVARRLGLGRRLTRTLLGCGVAAAVAASFNAPIAGVFFALEVVIGHYALTAFAPIVVAAVVGTLVSRMHYGDFPAFELPEMHAIGSAWEYPAFVLLGAVAALAAIIFIHSIFFTERAMERLPLRPWARPALGGLGVGLIALLFPEVLGVGYEATNAALREQYGLLLLLALIVAKTAATALSLGSGFGGGAFSPSLVLGAFIGGAFGHVAASAFPDLASSVAVYSIVGMGAVAGAVLGAPISTILIVFEMTGDYAITIALMVATAIASLIVQQVGVGSLFRQQLVRRGIDVSGGQESRLLREMRVRTLIERDYGTVGPDTRLAELRQALAKAPYGLLLVLDGEGRLLGLVTFAELAEQAPTERETTTAAEVMRSDPPVLQAEDDLEMALKTFRVSGEAHIPAVDNREERRLLGLVHEHALLEAYHRALLRAHAEERGHPLPERRQL